MMTARNQATAQAASIGLGENTDTTSGLPLPVVFDQKIINVPSQEGKEGHVLSTDGTHLQWVKASNLRQDTQLRTSAFTAQANTCYNVGWASASYDITLPDQNLADGAQIRFQNLNQSFGGANKKARILSAAGHSINMSNAEIYLQDAGIDLLLTYQEGNWATDKGGPNLQHTDNLMPSTISWKFSTVSGVSTYTLPAPALPHSDKELYSVNVQGLELLGTQFSIDQAKNQITFTAAPAPSQFVKVRCWLKHQDASNASDSTFPVGYMGLFDPTIPPSATHWKEYPAGDTLCVRTTTNFPRTGCFRGITRLQDGRIAVIGGYDSEIGYTNDCYFGTFDNKMGMTWVKSPSVYPINQCFISCVTLKNGKILAVTGWPNGGSCYLGTVVGNTINWVATTPFPTSVMHLNCLVQLHDGRCVSIAGRIDNWPENRCFISSATGTNWVATTNYPAPVGSVTACVLPNGKILAVGGNQGGGALPEVNCYIGTVTGNSIAWARTTDYPLGGTSQGQLGIIGNKIISVGGETGTEGWTTTACIGTYDAATNKLAWAVTDKHGFRNISSNQSAMVNLTPTQCICVGGNYYGVVVNPIDTVHIFEIRKAYVRV